MALSALGLTSGTAQAAPAPAPMYHHHWCPGDQWDNGWGPYQNWNNCRDWDDNYGGPAGYGPGGPGYRCAAVGAAAASAAAVGALGPGHVEQRLGLLGRANLAADLN